MSHSTPILSLALLVVAVGPLLAASPSRAQPRLPLREPSLARILRLAERYSTASPSAPRSAAGRARVSSLVPRLEVTLRRGLGQDRSLAQAFGGSDRTVVALDDSLSLEVRATLPLDGLVYRDREESLLREESRRVARRVEVVLAVSRAWARRRIALRGLRLDPHNADAAAALEIATAELDAWTGGAFGRLLAGGRGPRAGAASAASPRSPR